MRGRRLEDLVHVVGQRSRPPARNPRRGPASRPKSCGAFERLGVRLSRCPPPRRQPGTALCEIGRNRAGGKTSFTHRERMVGITVEAPWLMRKKTVRGGGSSTALSSALAEAMVRSFAGSTIIARQPPGLVRLRKERSLRTSSTPIEAALAAPAARRARTAKDARPPRSGARRDGLQGRQERLRGPGAAASLAQQEARRAIGEGRFADPPLARERARRDAARPR